MNFTFHQTSAQTYKVEEVSYEFVMTSIPDVNSKYDDFSPFLLNDQLIFTSGRESNLVLMGENNWGNTGFLNVFSAKFEDDDTAKLKIGVPQLFSKELSNNNHTGPIAFTPSGDTVFFTQLSERVKREKEIRHPQLYMAVKEGDNWGQIQRLPFNDKAYSYGHPSWDSKHQLLYFSSTMKGGKGGRDIYSVALKDGKWGAPNNLDINTEKDEMFPFIIGSDFFFASDREGGKGGLDIYWKQLNSKNAIQNVDQLNTIGDDHGLFISSDFRRGFVSQQHNGNDEIFMLDVTRTVTVTNELAGKFKYRNMGVDASNLKLQLLHDDEVVFEMESDDNGEFQFRDLPYENYTIKTQTEDYLELTLYDGDGNPITYLLQDEEGLFQYKKIDYEQAGTLFMLEEMNEKWLDYTDISGQFVYENIAGEYGDSLKVMLVDEDGNIVFTEFSDERGNFTFINVPTDQNYTITTESSEDDLFLVIYDQNGNVHTQLKQNENAEFIYKKIDPEYANNLQLLAGNEDVFEHYTTSVTGNFNYKNIEGDFENGLMVYLYGDDGILLDSATTNSQGQFNFRGLDPDKSYLFKMKESDLDLVLDDFNLHIEDRYGKVLMDLYRAEDGFFKFKTLDPIVENSLELVAEENENNFELEENNEVPEVSENTVNEINEVFTGEGFNVYFDRNSSYADFNSNQELQQLIQEMKSNPSITLNLSAFASCKSTDDYNLWLSERRGNRIKAYLVKKGISADRIKVLAFGESKLVNNCGDGIPCPDEEHAKNRRVEIIVSR